MTWFARTVALAFTLAAVFLTVRPAYSQREPSASMSSLPALARGEAEQTARMLGVDSLIEKLRRLRANRIGAVATAEELTARQDLLESIERASLDVDGVLAELSSERNQLGDLRASLENRRDRTVGRMNALALITGSGVSAAVSATQFTSLSSRTQNTGDAIGIGSGVAATIFSILAVRKQRGPSSSVGETPNMLAPLLGGTPVLNTSYPPEVMQYLQSVPAGSDSAEGTRLERLKSAWARADRLGNSAPDAQRKIRAVTTSENQAVKVTIDDLTDRIAMLGDVIGRVSLMKRDLAVMLRFYPVLFARE